MVNERYRILLVEDSQADAYLLRKALEVAGVSCELIEFNDGTAAMDFLKGNGPIPDLAVMDLNLPKNDGLEVLQAIRQSPRFMKMPVVVTSTSASPRDQAKVEQLGINRYIQKPPDLEDYLRIGDVLKQILIAQRFTATS